jgi:hypothetical protein
MRLGVISLFKNTIIISQQYNKTIIFSIKNKIQKNIKKPTLAKSKEVAAIAGWTGTGPPARRIALFFRSGFLRGFTAAVSESDDNN